jgi:hypothetical protein
MKKLTKDLFKMKAPQGTPLDPDLRYFNRVFLVVAIIMLILLWNCW